MRILLTLGIALACFGARAEALSYNVRLAPYSAAGTGSGNDTPAIQLAIDHAVMAGGGEVYLPAGTYRLQSTLLVYGPVTFRGEGQRISILRWDGLANGGYGIWFASQSTSVHQTLTVRGLSLQRHTGTGGAAIHAAWPHLGSGAGAVVTFATGGGVTTVIEDVHIGTTTWPNASVYWDHGIILANAIAAKIATFNIQGGGPNTAGAGIEIYGLANASGAAGRSVGVAIHDGTITGYQRGVRSTHGTVALNVQNLVIKDVLFGVEMLNPGAGTSIHNNQIWAQWRGIKTHNGFGDIAISNNQIYRQTDQYWIGIETYAVSVTSRRYRIISNYIWSAANMTQVSYGITLSDYVLDSTIDGNITKNMGMGVLLSTALVSDNLVYGNGNHNTFYPVSDGGTNNKKASNW